MPHSSPSRTSRTSSLKRLRLEMLPVYTVTPSRMMRALAVRWMTPLRTAQPARVPTFLTLERRHTAFLERAAEVFETRALLTPAVLGFSLQPLPLLGDLARLDSVGDDGERVARRRYPLEAEDLNRNRRSRLLDGLAALIVER